MEGWLLVRKLVIAHEVDVGRCIGLLGWIKSAALEVLTCNPSPKGVILPNFFCFFVPKIIENGMS